MDSFTLLSPNLANLPSHTHMLISCPLPPYRDGRTDLDETAAKVPIGGATQRRTPAALDEHNQNINVHFSNSRKSNQVHVLHRRSL